MAARRAGELEPDPGDEQLRMAGDPMLRRAATGVSPAELADGQTQRLIDLMLDRLDRLGGSGLAAPLLGVPARIVVVEDRVDDAGDEPRLLAAQQREPVARHVMVNPELEVADATTATFFEGCSSVPGIVALVPRVRRVRVRYQGRDGQTRRIDANGWFARLLLHQVDHLEGTLFTDRMIARSLMTQENYEQRWRSEPLSRVRRAFGIGAAPADR
jgi:peptide deformylase